MRIPSSLAPTRALRRAPLLLLLLAPAVPPATAADDVRPALRHDLEVVLTPAGHRLEVTDRVTFLAPPPAAAVGPDGGVRFLLHADLAVAGPDEGWVLADVPPPAGAGGTPAAAEHEGVPTRTWSLRPKEGAWPEAASVVLRYAGEIHHPPVAEAEEYARSFARSPGTVGEDGVVLSRPTLWVPWFGEERLAFRLAVRLPAGWDAVSQGERVEHERTASGTLAVWDSPEPMEEVYLIASAWTEYAREAGGITAYAFLRAPDPALADRYLEATGQYVEMYARLIGAYPFRKFALVENFWETGYGMPSFTLLGPQVIRLPFILHTSYPHEILHNWWGNSVYVDAARGNWCEGLTAYLADHLVREGQGRGAEYRSDTLKKYRSYVSSNRDFPLAGFLSRHSGATEAVGYGKSLFLYHMLRRRLGDQRFAEGLRRFYAANLWRSASFEDLATTFSEVAGEDLRPFFTEWVERPGAPRLNLAAGRLEDGTVTAEVRQVQDEEPWSLEVPLAVTVSGRPEALMVKVRLDGRGTRVPVPAAGGEVLRLDLDPEFDVFRRLDDAETPTTLGDLFGAEKVTLVVPAEGKDPLAAAWRSFAGTWSRSGSGEVAVVSEDALPALPPDRAVWVLGSENRWREALAPALSAAKAGLGADAIEFGETRTPRAGHSFALAVRHPASESLALGWVGGDVASALPGLARKLPHYGKHSYVAFRGEAPDNVAKGQWSAAGSPLVAVLVPGADGASPPRGSLPPREPLARLAPPFESGRLLAHVRFLADDALGGRGVGTPGIDEAAAYVAKAFADAGLAPGGDGGTWFEDWTEDGGPDGRPVRLRNVVGVLPGTKEAFARQSVVVGAHYDHLGLGWPDVRAGSEGQVHNGADDNASGVAVLLELARVLGAGAKPDRSLVFVAFSGEEWGRRGSRHHVGAAGPHPAKDVLAMLNLDTVGRLGSGKIQVLGTGTATEWPPLVMGVGYTTGVEAVAVPDDPQGSDQASYTEVGVPAVQLFTGAHGDYHRPSDDPEKVDGPGLVKVAVFAREAVAYLAARQTPLTATLANAPPRPAPAPGAGRKVLLGTVPAFDHPGPGVKVASVTEGSPAAAAGLRPGDLLLALDGEPLADLRAYSEGLKRHAPGDTVRLSVRRGTEDLEVTVTLAER